MKLSMLGLTLVSMLCSVSAEAATVVDTGIPGGNSRVLISGGGTNATYGALFTVAADTVLTSITAYFGSDSDGATASATIAENASNLPGVSLFNTSFAISTTNGSMPFTANFGQNALKAGSYFVLFSGSAPASGALSFAIGATNPVTTEVFIDERFSDYRSAGNAGFAFSLQGAPVQSISPVPEPATWAMMAGGFGLIGCMMRVRRRRLILAV